MQVQRDILLGYTNYMSRLKPRNEKPIRIGIWQSEINLPFYIADKEELFSKHGISVELVSFENEKEIEEAMLNGKIEAAILNLFSTAVINSLGVDVKIACKSIYTSKEEKFEIISYPKYLFDLNGDWENVVLGISNIKSDYISDKIFENNQIRFNGRKEIVESYDDLLSKIISNKIEIACIEKSYIKSPLKEEVNVIFESVFNNLIQYNLVFNMEYAYNNQRSAWSVVEAYKKGSNMLIENPTNYVDVGMEKAKMSQKEIESYRKLEPFIFESPTESDINEIIGWMVKKRLLITPLAHYDLVDENLIPVM